MNFKNLSLKMKLILSFVIFMLLFAVTSLIAVLNSKSNIDKIEDEHLQGLILFAQIVQNLKKTIHKEPRLLVSSIIDKITRGIYKKVQKSDIV